MVFTSFDLLHRGFCCVKEAMNLLNISRVSKIESGDLFLEGIRQWRENMFQDYQHLFPLWKIPYDQLLSRL